MKPLAHDVVSLMVSLSHRKSAAMKVTVPVDRAKLRRESGLCYTCARNLRGECGFPKQKNVKAIERCATYERGADTETGRPEVTVPVEVVQDEQRRRKA